MSRPIVYYDGLCALCDGFVRFVLKRDSTGLYLFAPLQGETARTHLAEFQNASPPTTIVLETMRESRALRTKSDAALAILTSLGSGWRLFALLRIIPSPLRDSGYDLIARHRYRWFGRLSACRIPTAQERDRFLP